MVVLAAIRGRPLIHGFLEAYPRRRTGHIADLMPVTPHGTNGGNGNDSGEVERHSHASRPMRHIREEGDRHAENDRQQHGAVKALRHMQWVKHDKDGNHGNGEDEQRNK
jgi:hypothetical protein